MNNVAEKGRRNIHYYIYSIVTMMIVVYIIFPVFVVAPLYKYQGNRITENQEKVFSYLFFPQQFLYSNVEIYERLITWERSVVGMGGH